MRRALVLPVCVVLSCGGSGSPAPRPGPRAVPVDVARLDAGATSTASHADGPDVARRPTMVDWLADDAPLRFPERCRRATRGPIQLLVRGETQGDRGNRREEGPRRSVVVLEQLATTVRVILEDSHFRLVALVRREDLADAPVVATRLSPGATPLAAEGEEGVHLAPGAPVEHVGRAVVEGVPMREVRGTLDVVSFRGWVPERALGRVWTEAPFAAGAVTGLVREGTVVGTRPKGATRSQEVARIDVPSRAPSPGVAGRFAWGVTSLGSRPPYELVRFVRPEIMVVGEVALADFKPKGPSDGEWTMSSGEPFEGSGGMTDAREWELAAGAPLFAPDTDADANQQVGVARAKVVVYSALRGEVTPRMVVRTYFAPVGFVRFAVASADLRPTETP